MRLFRPFLTCVATAMLAAATPFALPVATMAQEPITTVVDEIEQSIFFGADQVAIGFVVLAVIAAVVSTVIRWRADRQEAAANDFDGGFYDAWRLPDREPPD